LLICARWQIRKNKKGLEIEEIPFIRAKREAKTKTEIIPSTDYRPGLGTYDDSYYGKVTRYYCSKCGKEVTTLANFCKECGSYFG
jgi:predicted nucleic acid binding AN1-type Zn finger protein